MSRQISEITWSLITRSSFIETFWRKLRERRKLNPELTQKEVYESLELIRVAELGERCFPTFNSFRQYRDTHK